MSAAARGALQQLLRDLEENEQQQQQQPASTAAAAGPSSTPPQQLQQQQFAEGEVSSVSLGLSDLTRTENSDDDPTPGTTLQQQQRRHSSSGSSGSGLRRHVAELESKVLELLLDRKAADARHAREVAARDADLTRLQDWVDTELAELQQRQAQVEAAAPSVREQLQEARAALQGSLLVSAETYAHLKKIPVDRLQLSDAVRITLHEALQELSSENEQLRLTSSAARETAARQRDELKRLQRENARLTTSLASTQAELERMSGQMQDAVVAAEVGRAKVLLYDELSNKAEKLEVDVARLSGIEAAADRLRGQLAAADASLSERDATIQLLAADKAYLSKEAQVAESRVSELTARLASAEDKVTHLKGERSRLYQQLAAASDATRTQEDSRWEREIARLQEAAAADVQRIRQEAADMGEREARMLRELRDTALDEASRAKAELRQLRSQHEELLLASRDSAARADVASSQLLGELKLKSFELTRLQALSEERASAIEQLQSQLALANDKVAMVTAELAHLEQEGRQTVQELQQQLSATSSRLREYDAADGLLEQAMHTAAAQGDAAVSNLEQHLASLLPAAATGADAETTAAAGRDRQQQQAPGGSSSSSSNTLSAALQRRIHHNIQLASRCARLEAQKQALEAEKAELHNRLERAQAAAERLHQQLALVGQPHSFLLQQLAAAEAAAEAAQAELAKAQGRLSAHEAASTGVAAERAALRSDLERLLRERGTLDSLRRVVAAAMKTQQQQQGQQDAPGLQADQRQQQQQQQRAIQGLQQQQQQRWRRAS